MVTTEEIFIDYHLLDFIVLLILFVVWGFLNKVTPSRLFVPKKDSRCQYPHYDTGITEFQNLLVVNCVPMIIYTICYILLKLEKGIKYLNSFDFLLIILGHVGSITVSNILANILKIMVGRPRPDFFTVLGDNVTSETICPEDIELKEFEQEFKSFPSGHSASAMSGALFLCLFLTKAINTKQMWVKFLVWMLIAYPLVIGATRITHYRHHPDDVVMGLFLGSLPPIIFFISCNEDIFCNSVFP